MTTDEWDQDKNDLYSLTKKELLDILFDKLKNKKFEEKKLKEVKTIFSVLFEKKIIDEKTKKYLGVAIENLKKLMWEKSIARAKILRDEIMLSILENKPPDTNKPPDKKIRKRKPLKLIREHNEHEGKKDGGKEVFDTYDKEWLKKNNIDPNKTGRKW